MGKTSSKKTKFYVVWKGKKTGVFSNWNTCKEQIQGYKGAQYKSFVSLKEAQNAYNKAYTDYVSFSKSSVTSAITTTKPPILSRVQLLKHPDIITTNAIAVDAACSGNPGKMEYQGVEVLTKRQIFHQGPFVQGTNNIGEFLALVHALALLEKQSERYTVYSDSKIAMNWVKAKKCRTKLQPTAKNTSLFTLIARAEKWLQTHSINATVLKWQTKEWGEIPADFNRK